MKRYAVVADDDASFRRALTMAFASRGWKVDAADSVDMVERLTDHAVPEVLIIEPNLPGCSWYGLLRRLSRHLRLRTVIATSYISAAMLAAGDAFAVEACFAKPIDASLLVAAAESEGTKAVPIDLSADLSVAVREWEYINEMVRACEGNMSEAARRLGIPRQTLYRKLRKYPPLRSPLHSLEPPRRAGIGIKRDPSAFEPAPVQAWLRPPASLSPSRVSGRC